MSEKVRCFVALNLDPALKDTLQSIQEQLKKEVSFEGKYTDKQHMHLTLKFFGSIPKTEVQKIKSRLKSVKGKQFSAQLGTTGVFSEEFVRIIWTELEGNGIHSLQKMIDDQVVDFAQPEERFMSHITIARVNSLKEKEKLLKTIKSLNYEKSEVVIKSFSLMKSTLTPKGPIYEVIETYKLT